MKKSQKQAVAVGAGVAALAAVAAGVYMMTGKNAKNRKKVATWARNLESDVVAELKRAKQNSQTAYNKAIDTAVKNYKAARKVSAPELAAVAMDLKNHWTTIRQELEGASRAVRRIRPKAKTATRSGKRTPRRKS